jgi:hypothetical protein
MTGFARLRLERILQAQSSGIDTDIGKRCLPGGLRWDMVLDSTILPQDPMHAVTTGARADALLPGLGGGIGQCGDDGHLGSSPAPTSWPGL